MDLMSVIRQKRQTLISVFLIFVVIGLVILLMQDFKYGAKSKVLVIQEGAGRVDPFAVSRSVEYLSDLLSKVVYSYSFYEEVVGSDFNIDKSYFAGNSIKKMKLWRKTVSARSLDDSGIINMSVYHEDPYQASQIALAVNHVLINSHQNYHGLGSSVKISVIDQPTASSYPIKPNLIYGLAMIFSLGLFFGLLYIYLFPERKYDINFFARNSREVKKRPSIEEVSVQKEFKSFFPDKSLVERVMEKEQKFDDPLKVIDKIIEKEGGQKSSSNSGYESYNKKRNDIIDSEEEAKKSKDYEEIKKSADINSLFYED